MPRYVLILCSLSKPHSNRLSVLRAMNKVSKTKYTRGQNIPHRMKTWHYPTCHDTHDDNSVNMEADIKSFERDGLQYPTTPCLLPNRCCFFGNCTLYRFYKRQSFNMCTPKFPYFRIKLVTCIIEFLLDSKKYHEITIMRPSSYRRPKQRRIKLSFLFFPTQV